MHEHKIKIGALVSGSGSNLQAVMDACSEGRISGEVVFAGSDNATAGGLDRAARNNIPVFHVDYPAVIKQVKSGGLKPPSDFNLENAMLRQGLFHDSSEHEKIRIFLETRATCEALMLEAMSGYKFDLLVLAGFMRTFSPYFIDRVNKGEELPRIMNIHPAILPSFPGVDGYGDTFRYGCKVGGCTVHFIDYGEDTGPIIGQRSFPILPSDTLENIREKGLRQEWGLFPECIQLFAEGRLKIEKVRHKLKNDKIYEKNIVRIMD